LTPAGRTSKLVAVTDTPEQRFKAAKDAEQAARDAYDQAAVDAARSALRERHLAAVQGALDSGDLDAAAALAEAALSDRIGHPLLFATLASHREKEGRLDEALDLLHDLLRATRDPGVLRSIGYMLMRLDRLEEAVRAFGQSLGMDPHSAEALARRGMALTALSRIAEARRDFEAAAQIDPNHVVALDGLAGLALRRGEPAEAIILAQKALAAAPALTSAALTLAAAQLAQGRAAEAEAAARSIAADPATSVKDRVIALGLLGESLDAQRRFADAFAAWAQANALLQAHYRPQFEGRPGTLDHIRMMTQAVAGKPKPAIHSEFGALPSRGPALTHVFLLGFPRSGTTLLEQALEEHPDIITMPERDCLIEGSRDWLSDPHRIERLLSASEGQLEYYRGNYWSRVQRERIRPDSRVFVDKNPFNSFRLPLIARLFPEARILFAVRDPRDIVLSCLRNRFQMSAATWQLLSLEGAAALYAATMELVEASVATFALTPHQVALSALVADFDGETKRICEYLGVEWTPKLRDFGANSAGRDVATPSGPQLTRGLNAQGIGRWHDYADQLAPVLPILAPWTARFGD
jgi:tetratricopeptide (TPR) repeat protein